MNPASSYASNYSHWNKRGASALTGMWALHWPQLAADLRGLQEGSGMWEMPCCGNLQSLDFIVPALKCKREIWMWLFPTG